MSSKSASAASSASTEMAAGSPHDPSQRAAGVLPVTRTDAAAAGSASGSAPSLLTGLGIRGVGVGVERIASRSENHQAHEEEEDAEEKERPATASIAAAATATTANARRGGGSSRFAAAADDARNTGTGGGGGRLSLSSSSTSSSDEELFLTTPSVALLTGGGGGRAAPGGGNRERERGSIGHAPGKKATKGGAQEEEDESVDVGSEREGGLGVRVIDAARLPAGIVTVVEEENEEQEGDDEQGGEQHLLTIGRRNRSSERSSSLQVPSTPTMTSSPNSFNAWPSSPSSPFLPFATASAGAWHGASIDQFRTSATAATAPSPLLPAPRSPVRPAQPSRRNERHEEGRADVSRPVDRPTLVRTPPTDLDVRPNAVHGKEDPQASKAHDANDDDAPSLFKKPFPPPNYVPPSPSPLADDGFAASSSRSRSSRSHARQQSSISMHGSTSGVPLSPRFVLPPPSPSMLRSPRSPAQHSRHGSLFDPFPLPAAGDERMHARNLSAFFPEPGKQYTAEEVEIQKRHEATRRRAQQQQKRASAAPVTHKPGSANGWSFTRSQGKKAGRELASVVNDDSAAGVAAQQPTLMPPASPTPHLPNRRGYHHRHSLSHNFFSFMDPATTDEGVTASRLDTPQPSSSPFINGTQTPRLDSTSFPILPTPSVDRRASEATFFASLSSATCLPLVLGIVEFGMGMALWVHGQKGSLLGLTGVGYLVVFDAIGLLLGVKDEVMASGNGGLSSARLPFGTVRRETLAYFVQIIFLFFTAVFISKEAVEHVLTSGEGDHGHAHAHGDAHGSSDYPVLMLAVAFAASLMSAVGLNNHAKLARIAAPSGTVGERATLHMIAGLAPLLQPLLGNAFCGLVVGTSGAALAAVLLLPPSDLLRSDRALSFLVAYTAFTLAKSVGGTLGKVLLQTAPPTRSLQMSAMRDVFDELAEHPAVTRIARSHVWQLTPHNPQDVHSDRAPKPAQPVLSRVNSFAEDARVGGLVTPPSTPPRKTLRRRTSDDDVVEQRRSNICILVASLEIVVDDQTGDATIYDITRWAYERCSSALWCSRTDRGASGRTGEVTVKVAREDRHQHLRTESSAVHTQQHQHHSHSHNHSHSHHHTHHHH